MRVRHLGGPSPGAAAAGDGGDVDDRPALAGPGQHDGGRGQGGVVGEAGLAGDGLDGGGHVLDRARRLELTHPHELGHADEQAGRVLVERRRAGQQQLAASRHDGLDQRRVGQVEARGALDHRPPAAGDGLGGGRPGRHRAGAAPVVGQGHGHRRLGDRPARRPSRPVARCPGSARRSAGGSSAGRRRVNATAIGSGESLVTSTRVRPPASATDHTRCTASPPGMRSRVSNTGTPPGRDWRTATSSAGRCQRSSAATAQSSVAEPSHGTDRAPRRDVGPPRAARARRSSQSSPGTYRPHPVAAESRF